MVDPDAPTFTLRDVASATGWQLGTMRDYFVRGIFPWYEGDGKASVAGATSRLSLRGAIRLGLANRLWQLGVSPRHAFKAATKFTDFGNAVTSNTSGVIRRAGNLFPEGFETLLLWQRSEGARVVPINAKDGIRCPTLFGGGGTNSIQAVAIVHVDSVVADTMSALGLSQD